MRFLFAIISLMLVLYTANSDAVPVKYKAIDRKSWTLTESPNFQIVSDAKPSQVRDIAEQLERFRAFSILLMDVEPPASDKKSLLTITKSRVTWRALGLPKDLASLTLYGGTDGARIYGDVKGFTGTSLSKSNAGRAVIFSALAFKLFYEIDLKGRVPFWYYRAFSKYLAGYTEEKERFTIGALGAMGARLQPLFNSAGQFLPLDVVSIMSRKSFQNTVTGKKMTKTQRLKFSAQAYIMVHYFYADRARRKQLSDFIGSMKSGKSIDLRLLEAFGQTADELASAVSKYATSGLKVPTYDRKQIEALLKLPSEDAYQQTKLSKAEFWRIMYPSLVKLPDDMVSFDEKKSLKDAIKQYLPETDSLFSE